MVGTSYIAGGGIGKYGGVTLNNGNIINDYSSSNYIGGVTLNNATITGTLSGNAASATTAAACTGNAASATTAAACTGTATTATSAGTATKAEYLSGQLNPTRGQAGTRMLTVNAGTMYGMGIGFAFVGVYNGGAYGSSLVFADGTTNSSVQIHGYSAPVSVTNNGLLTFQFPGEAVVFYFG